MYALTAIFNFVAKRDRDHETFDLSVESDAVDLNNTDRPLFLAPQKAPTPREFRQEKKEMMDKREEIAQSTWNDREAYNQVERLVPFR